MAFLYQERNRGIPVQTSLEARLTLPPSGVIFERIIYNSPTQVKDMGLHSGVHITPEQVMLYSDLRQKPLEGKGPDSDQVLLAKVLEQTGGPVDAFKAAYPNIKRWN